MKKIISEVSVFFPCYNEEKNIPAVCKKAVDVLSKTAERWEIILINDGSSDHTASVIDKLAKDTKNVRSIHHEVNRGYGASLKTGLYSAKYKNICFTDADGQFDFSEIVNFVETQKKTNADIVVGYYKKRQVSNFKIITSKLWELVVYLLFGLSVTDIDCGFKLIKTKVIKRIEALESERGAFISSELLIKAKMAGFKIVEIPVTHLPRLKGKGTGRDINVIIRSFKDLFSLWMKLKKSSHKQ